MKHNKLSVTEENIIGFSRCLYIVGATKLFDSLVNYRRDRICSGNAEVLYILVKKSLLGTTYYKDSSPLIKK